MTTCHTCGRSQTLRWTPELTVEEGAVRFTAHRAPYRACEDEHHRTDLTPGVADVVVDHLDDALLRSVGSRLPWRGRRCGACGAPMTMPGRRTEHSVTVEHPDAAPFTVTLDVPMLRCPECGTEQLPHEVWPDVEAAARTALARRGTIP